MIDTEILSNDVIFPSYHSQWYLKLIVFLDVVEVSTYIVITFNFLIYQKKSKFPKKMKIKKTSKDRMIKIHKSTKT